MIYVNNFPESITEGELHLYADDTTACVIGDNPDDVIIKLNRLFGEICTWCKLNKLTLHTGKSEVMIIQRKQFVGPLLIVSVEIHKLIINPRQNYWEWPLITTSHGEINWRRCTSPLAVSIV